ncbi:hypothetical protein D9M70_647820 [compost metagenome]
MVEDERGHFSPDGLALRSATAHLNDDLAHCVSYFLGRHALQEVHTEVILAQADNANVVLTGFAISQKL